MVAILISIEEKNFDQPIIRLITKIRFENLAVILNFPHFTLGQNSFPSHQRNDI
jgi:hypothetical protein